ncbi:ATP-dependent DNA helicase [Salmonella enterica subsp. arizonae]|uniref:ATP-dependent DNA helicase n=1 Tax=Salmonella enterica subsp. arizonae TaxID=59203 RepID=A0A2X4VXH9_SALER|nr:ATP-dependent DNA helicase [Salmonella enterica subsp. arizonae]
MSGRLLDAVPLNSLTGVGAAQSSKLAKIGLHTVQDLLLHLPCVTKTAPISTRLASSCLASTLPLKVKY